MKAVVTGHGTSQGENHGFRSTRKGAILKLHRRKFPLVLGAALTASIGLAGCSGGESGGTAQGAESTVLDPAKLEPASIVGEGKYGEEPAMTDVLELTDEELEEIAAGDFTAGIVMQTMNEDWSSLTVAGITDTLEGMGVEIVGVTDAAFDVQTQIADIENMITKDPDVIISIPVDDVATAEAYRKVGEAGIKLVIIQQPPAGLDYPTDYQTVIAPDDQGNGQIAAMALSEFIPEDGVAGVIDFGVDFFTTNQRTLAVQEWFQENRPDVEIKEVTFTDPNAVGSVAANFVTANPDLDGLYVVWATPAMQTVGALRQAGVDLPITTIDLGTEVAVDMASNGNVKALGAQKPYDQGVAEAMAAANILLGKEIPPWITLPAVAVTPSNTLTAYEEVFHAEPPAELIAACEKSEICG